MRRATEIEPAGSAWDADILANRDWNETNVVQRHHGKRKLSGFGCQGSLGRLPLPRPSRLSDSASGRFVGSFAFVNSGTFLLGSRQRENW